MIFNAGGTEAGWPCGSPVDRPKEPPVIDAGFVNRYQTVLVTIRDSSYKLQYGVIGLAIYVFTKGHKEQGTNKLLS